MEHQMDYKFSTIVDPASYETHGLCDGIPLRCHINPELEELETLRCQEDWRRWVGPLGFYKGGLGPRWNFMAITVPECLPERLGVIGYANELAFLHDDCTDIPELEVAHNDDLMKAFSQGATTGEIQGATTGKRAIQAHIAREMLALNQEQATETMRAWAKFAELGSGRQHTTRFTTEADYIKYRMIDIGTMFWYGMVTFGMGISIPKEELDHAHELAEVAYLNLGLTNDLYSYQKEYDTAMALGEEHVTNIIWVLMEERHISEEAAKELCREKIKQTIIDFRKIVRESNARNDLSNDTKRYLEGLLYSLSGNLVWSIECPRYHPHLKYNDRQLAWMRDGIPKDSPQMQSTDRASTDTNAKPLHLGESTNESLVNVFVSLKDLDSLTKLHDEVRSDSPLEGYEPDGLHATAVDRDQRTTAPQALEVIAAPYDYVVSLPSKRVRDQLIDALNEWFHVSASKLTRIKAIVTLLHNASLMLDDFQDGSDLRRGNPATHTIFGPGQTVNAANFAILRALEEVHAFGDAGSLTIFVEELKNLYLGQGLDLHWSNCLTCPSIEEYFAMIDGKTGGLFRLVGRLMSHHATKKVQPGIGIDVFLNTLGRFYQISDDYKNLKSSEYQQLKGMYEDLDEGKYSLPLIHLIQSVSGNHLLQNILIQRRVQKEMPQPLKATVLALMEQHGSFEFTTHILEELALRLEEHHAKLEKAGMGENLLMRKLLSQLSSR